MTVKVFTLFLIYKSSWVDSEFLNYSNLCEFILELLLFDNELISGYKLELFCPLTFLLKLFETNLFES